ncbi:MAG: CoA transferase [Acidobacteria bacterium]|nr:CoA transferase [Acidobacteriota bacterium]
MSRRILAGIRVLDLTQVVAGPACTRMLADLGADVVKIDPPAPDAEGQRRSSGPAAQNVGKRSIVADLESDGGLAIARALAERADVLVQNYRPGSLERIGLGYANLKPANPRLVYATISGFGQDTSYRSRAAYGATAHAEAGLLWVQQMAQGGEAPFAPGVTIADIATGMNATMAILAALYDREQTGRGQFVDIALMDSQLAMLGEAAATALAAKPGDPWEPFRHGLQQTLDGYIAVNRGSDRNWTRLAQAMGQPGLDHGLPRAEAERAVAAWAATVTTAQAEEALAKAGAAFGVVRSLHDALRHPYFAERGMVAEVADPVTGTMRTLSSPLFFSDADASPTGPAPLAGAHTDEVLAELGYSPAEISELARGGVIQSAASPGKRNAP